MNFHVNYSITLTYEIWLVDDVYRCFNRGVFDKFLYVFRIEPYAAIGCPKTNAGRFISTMDQISLTYLNIARILPMDFEVPVVLQPAEDLPFSVIFSN
jgi:hypothetical protein